VRGRLALAALVYALAAAAFTWPMVTDPGGLLVTRQFDLWSTVWLAGEAPFIGADFTTWRTAWPEGQPLGRVDSILLLVFGRLLTPLLGADAVIFGYLVLGPIASALAAESAARTVVGARFPGSLVAGFVYGFSGVMLTALLEGHVYFMLAPWLPLLARDFVAALRPGGPPTAGILAGLWWLLSLLTSAYIGICATLVVLAAVLARPMGLRRPAPWAAAAVAVPAGLLYVVLFVSGGEISQAAEGKGILPTLQAGSATLFTLAAWAPGTDLHGHSIAPTLGLGAVAMAGVAPILLPARMGWRPWAVLGLLAAVGALGPVIDLWSMGKPLPGLWAPLARGTGEIFFHFPARLVWISSLCLGFVAARVVSYLLKRGDRARALPLVLFAAVDGLVLAAPRARADTVLTDVPSAYAAARADGALLELLPDFLGGAHDHELLMNNLTCAYQRVHGHTLLNTCIGVHTIETPRVRVGHWLAGRLLEGRTADLGPRLAALGIGSVAVHPTLYTPGERDQILAGLESALGPPVARSVDGGDPVVLFHVPGPLADRAAARAAYAAVTPIEGMAP
jgi:hypothetical protein